MPSTSITIPQSERTLAALSHLSGLAGYLIPGAGVVVPIIIWIAKSDSPVISSIAKQAILLNVVVFLLFALSIPLYLTVILIPLLAILAAVIALVAIVLPVFGAVKAFDGVYYRYPFVGVAPSPGTAGATGA